MLNDITIEQCVDHQDLILPYTEKQLNPNSYDVTLQDTIIIFAKDAKNGYADGGGRTLHGVHTETVRIDGHYMLQPGQFVLGATVEKISLPDNMMARFDGKSSLGRLGLCTHVTAGFIDAGFIGTITVELKNENSFPIMLTPGMRIGQVSFEYLNAASMKPYGMVGHYQHQKAPQPAVEV
jgi:dCTP deaminase